MFNTQEKDVLYSNNDWGEIVNKYNLQKSFEVVVREDDNSSPTKNIKHNHHWLLRTVLMTGAVTLFGNLPVQSQLLSPTPASDTKVFTINSQEIDLKSTTDNTHFTDTALDQLDFAEEELFPQELTLPRRAIEIYVGHAQEENTSKWKTYQVKSYDNLTNIFHKLGHQDTLKTLQADKKIKEELGKLTKGTVVRASSVNGKLSELVFSSDNENSYVLTKKEDNSYSGKWKKNIFEVRQSRSSFIIKNGLFFDSKKSGVAKQVIKQFVKVFDWDIDFSHDVRVGDKVTVVFEEIFHDGDKIGTQNLLAAEFINKGHEFRSIRYTNLDGKADYFTPEGREMKRAFIRTPIAHARVSSHFNPGRFHPKLHKFRAHKGTDFAARTGTPIKATGNGTIKTLGRKGGYGRTIIIKHREGYTTVYAHMSRYKKGMKVGTKVYQGDIIGYVGSSGLATGPHLHYEFRKGGDAIDPMKASLPNSMSLSRAELQDFRNKAINLVLQLNVLRRFVEAEIQIDSSIGG